MKDNFPKTGFGVLLAVPGRRPPPTTDFRSVLAGFLDDPGSEEYCFMCHSSMCLFGALREGLRLPFPGLPSLGSTGGARRILRGFSVSSSTRTVYAAGSPMETRSRGRKGCPKGPKAGLKAFQGPYGAVPHTSKGREFRPSVSQLIFWISFERFPALSALTGLQEAICPAFSIMRRSLYLPL